MTTTYKELLQQGVINNKVTLGELRLLLKDIKK
jgi:hypothetical protein